MIQELILLEKNTFYSSYLENGEPIKRITSLSKINFFIGANNSGKSRFIREILKDVNAYKVVTQNDLNTYGPLNVKSSEQLKVLKLPFKDILELIKTDVEAIKPHIQGEAYLNRLNALMSKNAGSVLDEEKLAGFYEEVKDFASALNGDFNKVDLVKQDSLENRRKGYFTQMLNKILSNIFKFFPLSHGFTCTYIPAHRSLRTFASHLPTEEEKNSNYYRLSSAYKYYRPLKAGVLRMRSFFDYFLKIEKRDTLSGNHEYSQSLTEDQIFTGESLFDEIRNLRNSPEEKRQILVDYEEFLSKYFFNGQFVSLNALTIHEAQDVYIKIGEDKEFPIYNLGDGIQAIILLTFPLFINRQYNHFVFYEEPELFLHPGMQRIFVEVLNSFPFTQAFIATHSNHFLDTTIDYPDEVSIFSLRKASGGNEPKFNFEMVSSPQVSILNELGVRNSSVLLANCSIWVEGVSDRMYIKRYLELYQKHQQSLQQGEKLYHEDMHYAFIEFGGNNITHYNFSLLETDLSKIQANSISNRIFLIHDADKGKEKRHQQLKKQLHNNYYQLEALEIENLLSPDILSKTLQEFRLKLSDELIVPAFSLADYEHIPLGEFVGEIVPKGLKKIFTPSKENLTPKLYNKVDFAHKALIHINNWNDLTPIAQRMTKMVYEFISKNNISY